MPTKLNWDKFAPKFGTWADKIKPFFDSGRMDPIYAFLKEKKLAGHKIAPDSDVTFRCFTATPLSELKAVIMGYCPYHTITNGEMVADGLCMGCENTLILQPSLEKFYEGLEHELYGGMCLTCYKSPSVQWLTRQGVLMFNSALTTEIGTAGAHQDIWEGFTSFILREIIIPSGVPIVFLGKEAGKFMGCLPPAYPGFDLYHPAYASYKKEVWDTKGVFTEVNNIIARTGGEEVEWMEHRLHEFDPPF